MPNASFLNQLCEKVAREGRVSDAVYRRRMMLNRATRQACTLTNRESAGSLAEVRAEIAKLAEIKAAAKGEVARVSSYLPTMAAFEARKLAARVADQRVAVVAAIRRHKLYRDDAPAYQVGSVIYYPGEFGRRVVLQGRFAEGEWHYLFAGANEGQDFPGFLRVLGGV